MGKKNAKADGAKRGDALPRRKNEKSDGGPVPIKKVPSLRGKNSVGLYAAGAFTTTAPSPGKLPAPPMRWHSAPATASTATAVEPQPFVAPQVSHPIEARLAILGNLLFLTVCFRRKASQNSALAPWPRNLTSRDRVLVVQLQPHFGELAGKLVGMLLELGADDVSEILSSAEVREEAIKEALFVLRDAGDERAGRALNAAPVPVLIPLHAPLPPGLGIGGLTVDIGAAQEAQAAAEGGTGSSGLTPAMQGGMLMRISPRISTNPYSSSNILRGGRFS